MKKLLPILLCLCITSCCFAYDTHIIGIAVCTPQTRAQDTVWTIGSIGLILLGGHIMSKSNNDVAVCTGGAIISGIGCSGLYFKIFEF